MRIALVLGWVAWWMVVAPVTSAQYAIVALESYGRGVHAHFSGDSLLADQYLTHAIKTNPRDPRPYYFRALNRLKLGRTPEALDDFGDGAMLEAKSPGQYTVGYALERVQGPNRLTLEKYRENARIQHAIASQQLQQKRYETQERTEASATRRRVPVSLDRLTDGMVASDFVSEQDPTRPPTIPRSGEAAQQKMAATAEADAGTLPADLHDPVLDAVTNPFADQPGGTKENDPFAVDAAQQEENGPLVSESQQDSDEKDPFADDSGEMKDDPFGGGNQEEDPFGEF
jgi:hypothetical protein